MEMEFNVNNIAQIKDAGIEEIENIEIEAKELITKIKNNGVRNDEHVETVKWCEYVISRCDQELKNRNHRESSDWELLFT